PYKEVSGAFGSFDFAISPADGARRWFVVAKSVKPWCSSTWSTIRYAALRPSPGRLSPRVLYAAEDVIWWGSEDLGEIAAGPADFTVRFHAGSMDLGIHSRVWLRHFAVHGDVVRRIPPVAVSARDFADEWINSPWQDAASWTAPERRPRLAALHAR